MATNPGGPSHAEVKQYWIDRDFPPNLLKKKDEFCYVKALFSDNKYLPEDYGDDLESLPPDMAKAYRDGDWNIFSGQYFKEFRNEIHVLQPDEVLKLFPKGIPKEYKRFRAVDWGRSPDPAYCGWFVVTPEGDVHLYREDYGTDQTPQHWGTRWKTLSAGETIAYTVGDPSMKSAGSVETGVSIFDMFASVGFEMRMANHDRHSGWEQLHSYLAWIKDSNGVLVKKPKFYIHYTCPYAIRTIPSLMHGEGTKAWDVADGDEDHAADVIRYALMTCPKPSARDMDKLDPRMKEALRRAQHQKNRK
jgi:hypothetical protein